nr:HepT-like ribonuclease domain-containing protein [Methylotetracoccus oryzae]
MTKRWQAYAEHIVDTIARIRRIESRGDLSQDEVLYDAALRNLQTLSEATQQLPEALKQRSRQSPGSKSAVFETSSCTTTWVTLTRLPWTA